MSGNDSLIYHDIKPTDSDEIKKMKLEAFYKRLKDRYDSDLAHKNELLKEKPNKAVHINVYDYDESNGVHRLSTTKQHTDYQIKDWDGFAYVGLKKKILVN